MKKLYNASFLTGENGDIFAMINGDYSQYVVGRVNPLIIVLRVNYEYYTSSFAAVSEDFAYEDLYQAINDGKVFSGIVSFDGPLVTVETVNKC